MRILHLEQLVVQILVVNGLLVSKFEVIIVNLIIYIILRQIIDIQIELLLRGVLVEGRIYLGIGEHGRLLTTFLLFGFFLLLLLDNVQLILFLLKRVVVPEERLLLLDLLFLVG